MRAMASSPISSGSKPKATPTSKRNSRNSTTSRLLQSCRSAGRLVAAAPVMLWSNLFIPTLREDPAQSETAADRLLQRAGYVRPLASGIYAHLLLSRRCILKIISIVRREMERLGAQEVLLPELT